MSVTHDRLGLRLYKKAHGGLTADRSRPRCSSAPLTAAAGYPVQMDASRKRSCAARSGSGPASTSSPATTRQRVRQLGLVVALLLIFGTQLTAGAILLVESRRSIPLELICLALVASLLVGVARAWELVGTRDTGIIASLAVLSRHAPGPARLTRLPGAVLAGVTADGDPATALRLYQELRPDRERVLGPGHPDTLTTHAEIAHWGQLAARL